MHNFTYISKHDSQVQAVYNDLVSLLRDVQKDLKKTYTFHYDVIGSYKRNMITYDDKGNVGFDLDVNIYPNDNSDRLEPKKIKLALKQSIDKFGDKYGFKKAEDSTRVLTIKVVDKKNSKVKYSVDFAIVRDFVDEDGYDCQYFIYNNKKQRSYNWQDQSEGYYMLPEKVEWVKKHGLWNDVRELYLYKKNTNNDSNLKSRTIFNNTVHEICQKNGFFDKDEEPHTVSGFTTLLSVKGFK